MDDFVRYDNSTLVRFPSLATLQQAETTARARYYVESGEAYWLAYQAATQRVYRASRILRGRGMRHEPLNQLSDEHMLPALEHGGLDGLNVHLKRLGLDALDLSANRTRLLLRELRDCDSFDLLSRDARTFLDCLNNELSVEDALEWAGSGEDPSSFDYCSFSSVPTCEACDRFGGCERNRCSCCGERIYECQNDEHGHQCCECGADYCGDHECDDSECDNESDAHYEQTGLHTCLSVVSSRLGDIPRLTSLEIECTNLDGEARYQVSRTGAGVGSDGSVYGDSAAEIRTLPFAGDPHVDHVSAVYSKLQGAAVNASCGLHLHLDMRETTESQLLHICSIWAGVERAVIASTVPKRRQDNQYCQPYHVRSDAPERIRNDSNRYRTLNVYSALQAHRTIEFRLWEGTLDVERALHFARIANGIAVWGLTDGSPTLNTDRRPTRDEWIRLLAARLPADTAEILLSGEIAQAAEKECA